jgi:parallel beta-helix repeat protein
VVIRHCELTGNRIGIALQHSSGIRIEHNSILDSVFGIILDSLSEGNTLVDNRLQNETNAVASAPNVWTEGGRGNCWSDFRGGPYQIGPGNDDLSPSSLDECHDSRDVAAP